MSIDPPPALNGFLIFARFWPGFTEEFPDRQFDLVPDEQLYAEVAAAAKVLFAERYPKTGDYDRWLQQKAEESELTDELCAKYDPAAEARLDAIDHERGTYERYQQDEQDRWVVAAKAKSKTITASNARPRPLNGAANVSVARPLPGWSGPFTDGLSKLDRDLLKLLIAVEWHGGRFSTPELERGCSPHGTRPGWWGLWSQRYWIGLVQGADGALEMAKYCKLICDTGGSDGDHDWDKVSFLHADARFGFAPLDPQRNEFGVDALQAAERFGDGQPDCPFELQLFKLAPLFDNRLRAAQSVVSGKAAIEFTRRGTHREPAPAADAVVASSGEPMDARHAHLMELFPRGVPDDSELVHAIVKLDLHTDKNIPDIEKLREITSEKKGSSPRASSLSKRIRKARSTGITTLRTRKMRTDARCASAQQ